MDNHFSVVMSVYKKETVHNFETAFKSIVNQTVQPDEIVLVRDGDVTQELQQSIDKLIKEYEHIVTYIPLEQNGGLGNALNIGVTTARNELIARMDSDDISVENRFEIQLNAFKENPDIDMVGGQVLEFKDSEDNIVGKREVPLTHENISEFLKSRCAFNHPTVMYKKSAVQKSGNYIEMHFAEDYFLWCRMLKENCKFLNLPNYLVKMRVSDDMYQRRGGYEYFKILKKVEQYKKESKIITNGRYLKNVLIRFCQCVLLTNKLRSFVYKNVLRKK